MLNKTLIATTLATIMAGTVAANPYFEPLTASNTNSSADSFNTAPFLLPPHFSQERVADFSGMIALFAANGDTYPGTFHNWDMLDFGGADNEFVFIPHEVGTGAGLTRLNRDTGEAVILLEGNSILPFDTDPSNGWSPLADNFGRLDPARLTPAGTLLTGEEGAGQRLFELLNPTTATGKFDANWRWLSNIPAVSHEGVQFDKAGNLYIVDENSSGSIYKFVPSVAGDYSYGQTFVLRVTGDTNDSAVGAAIWEPITDANNQGLTAANPFDFDNAGGRAAADEVGGTGYCRPEDMTVNTLSNGNEAIYFTATCTYNVFSIELLSEQQATVREFASAYVTPDTIGNDPVGRASGAAYGLSSPDNLAADAAGNVFIIEDQNPGDIWMASDSDRDGVAESVAMFASLGDYGSEPTGFKADPRDPFTFYVNIQHPSKQGNNDALWKIKHDIADLCGCDGAANHGKYLSCVAKATKTLGIKGRLKSALMGLAANSSCGK